MKNTTKFFILFLCLWISYKILKYRVDRLETQVEELSKSNKILIEMLKNNNED